MGRNNLPENYSESSWQGPGASTEENGFSDPQNLAMLLKAGGGDPSVKEYIRRMLMGQATSGPGSLFGQSNRAWASAAFNPPGADVRAGAGARSGGGGHMQGAMQRGSVPANSQRNPDYEAKLQDQRAARNRQSTLDQDYNQSQRMDQGRLSLLQQIMNKVGGGRSNTSSREEIFNNAGGPQVMQLHSQQSFSPQDLLQFLMR